MLKAVEETAKQTLHLIDGIKDLMQTYKFRIRSEFPKIYSQDLLNNLFKHPYTKIEFVEKELRVSRQTASVYLNKLCGADLLIKMKIGKSNYYLNSPLFNLLLEGVPQAGSSDSITTTSN